MNISKNEKLLLLYEAIGEIDEKTATDALGYRHRANIKGIRLAVVLAACICILIATLTVGLNIALGGAKAEDPMDDEMAAADGNNSPETVAPGQALTTPAVNDEAPSDTTTEPSEDVADSVQNGTNPPESTLGGNIEWLEALISENKGDMTKIDGNDRIEELLNNGKLSVIVTDSVGGIYAAIFENEDNIKDMKTVLAGSVSQNIAYDEKPNYKVWVSFGDGSAVTPYLEYNDSNKFTGKLSEYTPTVYPSSEFVAFFEMLLKNN